MAVFGVIMMSMTMPIMVSNFNSLYINAVVGQPSAIKTAHKEMETKHVATMSGAHMHSDLYLMPMARSTLWSPMISATDKDAASELETESVESKPGVCCRFWYGACRKILGDAAVAPTSLQSCNAEVGASAGPSFWRSMFLLVVVLVRSPFMLSFLVFLVLSALLHWSGSVCDHF